MLSPFRSLWRSLTKNPLTSALAVLALTLGIGLTISMFSVVYGTLLNPPPFEEPHRVMDIVGHDLERGPIDYFMPQNMPHDFLDWKEQQQSFGQLAAYTAFNANLNDEAGYPARVDAVRQTWNTFGLLGLEPILGRDFRAEDDQPGAEPVALIGHALWSSRFAGDPGVLGQQLRINDDLTTIIGVMPEDIEFPANQNLWMPLQLDLADVERGDGNNVWIVGRLRDGSSKSEAQAEFTAIASQQAQDWPGTHDRRGILVRDYRSSLNSQSDSQLIKAMFVAVFLVLLIACANVACLLLAKASGRSRELAIRTALGAGRLKLVALVLGESLILALIGTLGGLALARVLTQTLQNAFAWQDLPYWISFAMQPSAITFAIATGLVAGLMAGLLPALRASGAISFDLLKEESRGSSGMRIGRLTRTLVMAELALACALLVVTGLLVKSVLNFQRIDPGFDTESIYVADFVLPDNLYPKSADAIALLDQLTQDLTNQPGVRSAAAMSGPPGTYMGFSFFAIEGETYNHKGDYPGGPRGVVTDGFFATFGIEAVEGRLFDSRDLADSAPVTVVNQSFARENWPGESALGKRMKISREEDQPWHTVVGVVPDAGVALLVPALANSTAAGFYVPHSQLGIRQLSLAVATQGDPMDFGPKLRERAAVLAPGVPVENGRSMNRVVWEQSFGVRTISISFAFFGAAALLLAALGIFGVTLFSVGQRTREFGIRLALGAVPQDVTNLVLKQGLIRLMIGLVIGLAMAVGLASALSAALYGVEATDPAAFATAVAVLAFFTLLASYLPAWRASRVDPLVALRHD